jgi:hypothetical protein
MSVSLSRRFFTILVVSAAALGCTSLTNPAATPPGATTWDDTATVSHTAATAAVRSLCSSGGAGSQDANGPIICVDDTFNPPIVKFKTIRVNDRVKGSSNPVLIQWFTRTATAALKVLPAAGNSCVEVPDCYLGGGHCRVHTLDVSTAQSCEYDVWVGTMKADPIIIVQPCCAGEDLTLVEASQMQ